MSGRVCKVELKESANGWRLALLKYLRFRSTCSLEWFIDCPPNALSRLLNQWKRSDRLYCKLQVQKIGHFGVRQVSHVINSLSVDKTHSLPVFKFWLHIPEHHSACVLAAGTIYSANLANRHHQVSALKRVRTSKR